MEKTYIFELSYHGDDEHTDELDDDPAAHEGAYRVTLTGQAAASDTPQALAADIFRSETSDIDWSDYLTLQRPERQADRDAGDGWLRRDLGSFSEDPCSPELPGL